MYISNNENNTNVTNDDNGNNDSNNHGNRNKHKHNGFCLPAVVRGSHLSNTIDGIGTPNPDPINLINVCFE